MIIFCGEIVTYTCIKCNEKWSFHHGITKIFEDEEGSFWYEPLNKCDKCGHIVNSERLPNAKPTGVICL